MPPGDSVLIIGGGLTGLSCAYHLGGGRILEKAGEVGGLCRSYSTGEFTFDYTGHLLHLRDPYARELVGRIAPEGFMSHVRRAMIHSKDRLTRYPFQANLYGLPREVIEECLEGLREARESSAGEPDPQDFGEWIISTFGRGIARHFMAPYNRKLWRVPLEELTTEWVEGMVPVPRIEDAVKGSKDPRGVTMGYNARFLYPAEGGITMLPAAFAGHVPRIHLNREVVQVDADLKKVYCRDGQSYHYEFLVSTMPLPLLVRSLKSHPAELARAAEKLRYVSVYDLNIGIRGRVMSDAHWIYFPEDKYIFYRVGFPGNFSTSMVPEGGSSAYIEVSHLPEERLDTEEVVERSLQGMRECRLLLPDDDIRQQDMVHIPYAYVLFDRQRKKVLPGIRKYLEERQILTVGRYGGWDYYSMEDAILAGRSAAAMISGGHV